MVSPEQAKQVIGHVWGAHGKVADPVTFNSWYAAIKHIDFDILKEAAKLMKANNEEWPNVAKFLSYVEKAMGITVPSLSEATAEVRNEIHRCGYAGWHRVQFSHPSIAQAIGGELGWRELCGDDEHEWQWKFQRNFKNTSERSVMVARDELTRPKDNSVLEATRELFQLGE